MNDRTIINLTDDTYINPEIINLCRKHLVKIAGDIPIVCVSQSEEVPIGRNIRMGPIGRGWWSFYTQLLAGTEAANTDFVFITERDMFYPRSHFDFNPQKKDIFYFNNNMWMFHWFSDRPEYLNQFSYRRHRKSNATMVCSRDFLISNIKARLEHIRNNDRAYRIATLKSDKAIKLAGYFKDIPEPYEYFNTRTPVIDVRHETNFSGRRFGALRRPSLRGWGTIDDIRRSLE